MRTTFLIGALLLPAVVWLVKTAGAFRKAEKDSPVCRRYGIVLAVLTALILVITADCVRCLVRWGADTVIVEGLIGLIFFGIPLAAVSLFVPALTRYKRCPEDAPERAGLKRKLRVTGVIAGCIIGAVAVLFILAMIGIMNM